MRAIREYQLGTEQGREFMGGGGAGRGILSPRRPWPANTALAAMHIAYYVVFADLGHVVRYPERDVQRSYGMPLFLPAARTGSMLLYKSVVGRQLDQLIRMRTTSEPRPDLTTPAVEFLKLLAVGLKPEVGPYAEEADFLEAPLQGRVELSTGVGVNEYYFRPASGERRLTMALSSSLVSELAPLILILRHFGGFPVLILEEPEAHLHPHMQRHLARTIVRLIRKGLYVWITTHSENFCQQLNNFLTIGESPRRAELQRHLGYEENEYLTLDDVSGYQFTLEGEKSKVTELRKKKRGLVMPTFNREIMALSKETNYLADQTTGDR